MKAKKIIKWIISIVAIIILTSKCTGWMEPDAPKFPTTMQYAEEQYRKEIGKTVTINMLDGLNIQCDIDKIEIKHMGQYGDRNATFRIDLVAVDQSAYTDIVLTKHDYYYYNFGTKKWDFHPGIWEFDNTTVKSYY